MVYLKKIEMYGFKSFADKVELKFNQPITGIVGPNGCGKSNVSDAVRWVLGEQSSKDLRGKTMRDFIFNGTDARKSMSYCEVSLFLDNTTRLFPIQMDEIVISRKLYRNNDSEYLLNRNVVRLKDILDMLRGVGLGKEGYSIVGQGRMDAVLSANPTERRGIFEEALGISRFRVKKNETERRLASTRINIDRLSDLTGELERQLAPLRRRSETAKKYLALRDKLRYQEINAYIYNYDNASMQKDESRKKIAGLKEELALRSNQYDEINEKYDELMHEIAGIDGTLAALHSKRVELAVAVEKNAGDKNLVNERISNVKQSIASTEEEIAKKKAQLAEFDKNLDESRAQLNRRKEESVALENEISAAEDKFNKASEAAAEVNAEMERTQQSITEILRLQNDFSGNQASFAAEKQTLDERLSGIAKQQEEISRRISSLSGEEGALIARYEQEKKQRDRLSEKIEKTRSDVKEMEFAILDYGKTMQRCQQNVASEKGSIELLVDFVKNYRGYSDSVKNLMNDAKSDEALSSRICDVVAGALRVDEKYQTAIEVALGQRTQNVITENIDDTKYLINYLKENSYGRVTFLPAASMKPRDIERKEVLREKGVLGVAVDLVKFDEKYRKVFQSLLGGIIVTENYDVAVAVSKKYGGVHRIVTLEGERISNDGSVEGGGRRVVSSLLSTETELERRKQNLVSLQKQAEEAEKNYADKQEQLQKARAELSELTNELQKVTVAIATDREKIETSNTLGNADKQNILGLESEKEKIVARIAELKDLAENAARKLANSAAEEEKLTENLASLRETLAQKTSVKDDLQENLTRLRYRDGVLKSNIAQSETDVRNVTAEIVRTTDELSERTTYRTQLLNALDILNDTLKSSGSADEIVSQLQETESQIDSVDSTKAELNAEFKTAGDERTRLTAELENIKGSIDKEEYILNKIDDDLAELQQRVYEEYDITYSAAMQFKDENYDATNSRSIIAELRQSIQRLGNVDVNSIEDLKGVEERYGEYSGQLSDLLKAESDLKDILKELTEEIEGRFETGMEQINENFKTVFRELFNGGNAKLTLDKDPEKDPLDYGIEIEAQPPGKRLQTISLLSGGERTLTAAAILFAILKLNPMPFCVLDEIEAALDDANAERIARFLRKFSADTQFIVITHKKPTMENADVLYGVTMEEKGVSKIVSVKLSEAIQQEQQAAN